MESCPNTIDSKNLFMTRKKVKFQCISVHETNLLILFVKDSNEMSL